MLSRLIRSDVVKRLAANKMAEGIADCSATSVQVVPVFGVPVLALVVVLVLVVIIGP